VPIFLGEAASRILGMAEVFGCAGLGGTPAGTLSDRRPFDLGPFHITPFLVDHSAFDSYSLLIEAGGKRLFYTGDFRATGAKTGLFYRLLREPPTPVDVLLMEGTNLRAGVNQPAACRTERDVKAAIREAIAEARGMVLVAYSGQNIDRLCSIFGAARACRRELVVDLYTAVVAAATGNRNIPQPGFDGFRVYVPRSQRRRILRTRRLDLVDKVSACRVYESYINAHAGGLVLTFRKSVEPMLESLPSAALQDAVAVWSQWHGYLDRQAGTPTLDFCRKHGIPLVEHHTSGHAGLEELRKLVLALDPRRVVPIHTEAPKSFAKHFQNVELHTDGERWEV
jgi:ribonuclease J